MSSFTARYIFFIFVLYIFTGKCKGSRDYRIPRFFLRSKVTEHDTGTALLRQTFRSLQFLFTPSLKNVWQKNKVGKSPKRRYYQILSFSAGKYLVAFDSWKSFQFNKNPCTLSKVEWSQSEDIISYISFNRKSYL